MTPTDTEGATMTDAEHKQAVLWWKGVVSDLGDEVEDLRGLLDDAYLALRHDHKDVTALLDEIDRVLPDKQRVEGEPGEGGRRGVIRLLTEAQSTIAIMRPLDRLRHDALGNVTEALRILRGDTVTPKDRTFPGARLLFLARRLEQIARWAEAGDTTAIRRAAKDLAESLRRVVDPPPASEAP